MQSRFAHRVSIRFPTELRSSSERAEKEIREAMAMGGFLTELVATERCRYHSIVDCDPILSAGKMRYVSGWSTLT